MKKILTLVMMIALVSGAVVNAQKVKVTSGSLDFLSGQKSILVKYDYSNMAVGKFEKEDDYLTEKAAKYNADEAGKGDKWRESWANDRATRYEPKFEKLFNEYAAKKGFSCSQAAMDAEYQMTVHTTKTEPGFNIGVMRQSAYINVEIVFTKIADNTEMAVMTIDNCPGRDVMGFDFDTAYRLEEAYAKLGKSLAGPVLKVL